MDEMHQKLQHLQLALVNRKGPILLHNNAWPHVSHASKVEQIGVQSFASSAIFNWPLANQLPQLFCRENASTTSKEAENAFLKFLKSWSTYLYATGINQLISHWQKCVDCNGSYLITKDVFKPSYDLKFIIQNHNYICTNLIAVCLRSVPWSFWTCLAMQLCVIEAMVLNGLTVFGIEQELHKSY